MESRCKDPVCGISLDPGATPRRTLFGDQEYFFCSDACREKFAGNPAGFALQGGDGGTAC